MTTRIYRWDDVDAPIMHNCASLQELLKLIFVGDGSGIAYGNKPCLDWSLEYEATGGFVVRSKAQDIIGNSKAYFKIHLTNAAYLNLYAYKTMSNYTTGTYPIGLIQQKYLTCQNENNTYIKRWWIIGDEKTIWIHYQTYGNRDDNSYFACATFGDFNSFKQNDEYNYYIFATNNTSSTNYQAYWMYQGLGTSGTSTHRTLAVNSTNVEIETNIGIMSMWNYGSGHTSFWANPNPYTGKFYGAPMYINDNEGIIGQLRGCLFNMNRTVVPYIYQSSIMQDSDNNRILYQMGADGYSVLITDEEWE